MEAGKIKIFTATDCGLGFKLVGDGDKFPTLYFYKLGKELGSSVIEAHDLIAIGKKLKKWGESLAKETANG